MIDENNNEPIETEEGAEYDLNEQTQENEEIKGVISGISIDGDVEIPDIDIGKIDKSKVLEGNVDDDIMKLYLEFNSFLDTKVGVKDDFQDKIIIPTGIDVLDAAIGGGFCAGTIPVITGSPGGFKSTLATQFLAQVQKLYPGALCVYIDSEEAMTTQRLANLGVRYPKIRPKTDVTIEKMFKTIEGLCLFKEAKNITNIPSIVICDSLSNTQTQKERETDDPMSVLFYKPKLLSFLLPKYVAKLSKYNICFMIINQLRDKVSMGPYTPKADLKFLSNSKDMSGGRAIKYNSFQMLETSLKSTLDEEKYGFNGVTVSVKSIKNKIAPPNVTIDIASDFNTGFDNFWSSYLFLVDTKRIVTGAWNYLVSYPSKKFRTRDAKGIYNTDENFKKAFDDLSKEAIQKDIINKYNPVIY